MDRSARAAFLGIAVAASLAAVSAPASAQQNGSIYTQCPGDTNGDGSPGPGRTPSTAPTSSACTWRRATASSPWRTAKPIYTFGFSDVTGKLPSQVVNGTAARRSRRRQLPGADHPPEGRAGVLPVAHQRRDDPAPRPLRPSLGALPRLPAGGVGLRRRARVLRDHQHGLDVHLLLQHRRRPGRDVHVPLPRRGHRAHPDGDGRQPLHRPEAERDAARPGQRHRRRPEPGHRPSRWATSTTTATARPSSTSSTRSSSARSTRTSTTSTSRSSRCPSRRWTTSTRC